PGVGSRPQLEVKRCHAASAARMELWWPINARASVTNGAPGGASQPSGYWGMILRRMRSRSTSAATASSQNSGLPSCGERIRGMSLPVSGATPLRHTAGPVFELDAGRLERVAYAIRLGEIPLLLRFAAGLDHRLDLFGGKRGGRGLAGL